MSGGAVGAGKVWGRPSRCVRAALLERVEAAPLGSLDWGPLTPLLSIQAGVRF